MKNIQKKLVPFIPLVIGILLIIGPRFIVQDEALELRIMFWGLITVIGSFVLSFVTFAFPKEKRDYIDLVIMIIATCFILIAAPRVFSGPKKAEKAKPNVREQEKPNTPSTKS